MPSPGTTTAPSLPAHSPRSNASPKRHDSQRVTNQGRRRQKISLACDDCRAKKIRCDGLRPQCSACRRKGSPHPCRYYQTETSRGAGSRRFARPPLFFHLFPWARNVRCFKRDRGELTFWTALSGPSSSVWRIWKVGLVENGRFGNSLLKVSLVRRWMMRIPGRR